jgi:hypothetical protein
VYLYGGWLADSWVKAIAGGVYGVHIGVVGQGWMSGRGRGAAESSPASSTPYGVQEYCTL